MNIEIDKSTEMEHEALSAALEDDDGNVRELLEIMDAEKLGLFRQTLRSLLSLIESERASRS